MRVSHSTQDSSFVNNVELFRLAFVPELAKLFTLRTINSSGLAFLRRGGIVCKHILLSTGSTNDSDVVCGNYGQHTLCNLVNVLLYSYQFRFSHSS